MQRVAVIMILSPWWEPIEPVVEGQTSMAGSFYREGGAVECVGRHPRTGSRLASPLRMAI